MSTITSELSSLLNNSLTQYVSMRTQAQARLVELEKEKEELNGLLGRLSAMMGTTVVAKAAPAPRAKRGTAKRSPRKAAVAAAPATDGAVAVAATPTNRVDHDAITTAVIECVRKHGPIAIKAITETIAPMKGVRYDTVATVINDNKSMMKVQGERPRLYSIA